MPRPPDDCWRLSAVALARRYREGSLTPLQAVQSSLARIAQVNPAINAWVAVCADTVLAQAHASTARFAAGKPRSLLDGIALSIKDNIPTADMLTCWGSPALRNHQAQADEPVVARARAAGALIVGKTNVPEFTLEGYTANPVFGVTRNPWNLALTPGGSSGGAVASVAAGCTPLALGTDGGGSIRRPASHTGLVGLKPSIGAIARPYGLPRLLLDFEVVGPIARTVADARLLFDALRGPDPQDRLSLWHSPPLGHGDLGGPPAGLRILSVATLNQAPVDPQIATSLAQASEAFAAMGHCVTRGPLPLDLGFLDTDWPLVGQIGLAAMFAQHPNWRADASEKFQQMARAGEQVPAHRLWQLLEQVAALRSACVALFSAYDAVLMPAAAALPWPADEAYPAMIDGQPVGPRGHAAFTGWVNAAGLPALALPAAPARDGLPIGLQLIGGFGTESRLLALGEAWEQHHPWAHRWPPEHTAT